MSKASLRRIIKTCLWNAKANGEDLATTTENLAKWLEHRMKRQYQKGYEQRAADQYKLRGGGFRVDPAVVRQVINQLDELIYPEDDSRKPNSYRMARDNVCLIWGLDDMVKGKGKQTTKGWKE